MALIANTIQGVGQPTRGTALSSLGSTGLVFAWNTGLGTQTNNLLKNFGTVLRLNLVAQSPVASERVTIWGRVPSIGPNPDRNWPVDYVESLGSGPSDRELWIPLGTVDVPTANSRYQNQGPYVGTSISLDLEGVDEVAVVDVDLPASSVLMARFTS